MTQRLPIPGQDSGTWGEILNGFLEVSLNADGTLSTTAVTSALPSPIPTTNLGSGTASSSNFLRGDGTWAVPNSGSSALASDSDVTITSPTNNQVLTYNSGVGKWENLAAVNSLTLNGGSAQTGAVSINAVQLAGDLGNTVASPQVTSTHLSSALPINQGGTGSTTQNFVDLSSTQTVGGAKTFSSTITGNISGNAATATTNANLTGPITSTGNTTAVAAQTGTGSTFVMSASPTLTGTPLAPTATAGTNTTQVATTAFVQTAISLINTVATSGSAQTLQAETMNHITLSTNCTLTLPTATAGSWFIASFIQPASGGPYTPTITSADYGASGTPTWSTAASKKDIIVGICDDGSTWDVALIATGGF